jgi:hypothetical protein
MKPPPGRDSFALEASGQSPWRSKIGVQGKNIVSGKADQKR